MFDIRFRRAVLSIGTSLIALVAFSGCTNHRTPQVLGLKSVLQEPAAPTTIPPTAPIPSTVPPTVPAPAISLPPAPITAPTHATNREVTQSIAAYELEVSCEESGHRKSGAFVLGPATGERQPVDASLKMSYRFAWSQDDSNDPIVDWSKSCTLRSVQIRAGAEPRLSVLLGCEGRATYSQNPKPTSAIDRSWSGVSALESGFTHTMTAPKSEDQLSETDTCTIWTASR